MKLPTLRSPREFLKVRRRGLDAHAEFTVVRYLPLHDSSAACRFGITVSRKVGNAVTRNLCRRRIREALRAIAGQHPLLQNYPGDVVVIARPCAATAPYRALKDELLHQLARLDRKRQTGYTKRGGLKQKPRA